ncbi:MarR family winged helix-turn-helix transcriptional regulator [Nocardioides mangrovi]|uniref:MarR family transcriptional regulator n=1 Tax=Nocardioides mangrovi TaxID=2874580 RepID=A0ABS7U9A8_9ACTN|nr:MarR family transcriptional regulator [Nocardioides mangrovi]MBZ5737444.1 MarR family transcriptional regulator [Nocardioides mangrovi]
MSDIDLASDLVVQAARLVRAVRRELELPAGTRVLSLLDQYGPLGITQLAELDRCSQPTMSGAVATLVELGRVAKEPNPEDARSSLVTLTRAGRAELARVRTTYGEHVAAVIAADPDLTTDDLATAVAVLRSILEKGPQ